MDLPLKPSVGLLFPSENSVILDELGPKERPSQIVVIDGTWHQAKTIFRDVPALHQLTQYRLAPKQPGNYRIRREPTETSLSTVEAVVAMLKVLEPNTAHLDSLLDVFHRMVDDQLAHPNCRNEWRRRKTRARPFQKIPRALTENLDNVVVAYAETTPAIVNGEKVAKQPVYWVAKRLGDEQTVEAAISTEVRLGPSIQSHYELSESFFDGAITMDEFGEKWKEFLRPTDVLAVYYKGTLQLLRKIGIEVGSTVILKGVCNNLDIRYKSIEELVTTENISSPEPTLMGRAGKRLALAIGLSQHLSQRPSD
jgi:hypothetical protein